MKSCLSSDHHDDTGGHDQDDKNKTPGRLFEVKEERENEDEAKCRRFAHC